MTSNRVAGLAVITLSMFAFSIFMKDGVFLYPFGLFKAVLFILFPVMLIVDKTPLKIREIILILSCGAFFLSSNFFLQIIFPEVNSNAVADRIVSIQSFGLLIGAASLLLNAVLFAKEYNDSPSFVLGIAFLGFAIAILSNHWEWIALTLPLWFLAAYLKGSLQEHFRSYALLMGLLIFITTVSALFFGKDQVLFSL